MNSGSPVVGEEEEVWASAIVTDATMNVIRPAASLRLPGRLWYWRVVREHLTKTARKLSNEEIMATFNYARKEGGQKSAPELNRLLSHHIIKRARRAGLIAAKEEPHHGLCRYCQATQRQFKAGPSRHGTQQFRGGVCGRKYQDDYVSGRIRPRTISLAAEHLKRPGGRAVSVE